MKLPTTSTLITLCAISPCLAQIPVVQFYIGGGLIQGQGYQSYNLNVPQDGSTLAITNTIDVYTIIPSDTSSSCTFIGRDGTSIRTTGGQIDILVQPLVSVTCLARSGPVVTPTEFPNFTSFFPSLQTVITPITSTSVSASVPTLSITSSGAGTVPPYPLPTGSSGVSASASTGVALSGTASPTGGNGGGGTVPFTGDAGKLVGSVGGALLALVGLVAAL